MCQNKYFSSFHAMYVTKQKKLLELRWAHLFRIFIHKLFVYRIKFGTQKKISSQAWTYKLFLFFSSPSLSRYNDLLLLWCNLKFLNIYIYVQMCIWELFSINQLNTLKFSFKFCPISFHNMLFCFENLTTILFVDKTNKFSFHMLLYSKMIHFPVSLRWKHVFSHIFPYTVYF